MGIETASARFEAARSDLFDAYAVAQEIITPSRLMEVARRLAEVRAPSGTVFYTIGPELTSMVSQLKKDGYSGISSNPQYLNTNNPAITVSGRGLNSSLPIPVWILNHGDEISFYANNSGQEAKLTPLHASRHDPKAIGLQNITLPGVALRYRETESGIPFLEQVAKGLIVTDDKSRTQFVSSHGSEGSIQVGDRVVYDPEPPLLLTSDDDTLAGKIDNRVGGAIGFMAGIALAELNRQRHRLIKGMTTVIAYDDHEEGEPTAGQFARGARDLACANRAAERRGTLYIVNDGHDIAGDTIPRAALVAGVVSGGKGPILDPDSEYRMRMLINIARGKGGNVLFDPEGNATTSRSSDQGLVQAGVSNRDIQVIGYGEQDPHYANGRQARASLQGAVETARWLALVAVAAGNRLL